MRNLYTLKNFSLVIIFLLFAGNAYSQTIVNVSVAAADSGDDAEERIADGVMDLTSSDLELCRDTDGDQLVGIRFQGVTVPQGATITNAYIQFQADQVTTGSVIVDITGIDVDDAAQFTSTAYNISDRIDGDISDGTTATSTWSIADWNTIGDNGVDQRTPNISAIVKELIDRSGWSFGNDMAFVFSPNSGSPNFREPEDGDNASDKLELHIEYTTPTGSEINVLGNNNTIIDGSTAVSTVDDTDFESVVVASPVAHTFTIQNFGTTNLTVVNPVITGHTADFAVTTNPTSPVSSGSNTTFTITFTPTTAGTRSASVTISNNDSDENPYTFNIEGEGVVPAPEINITGNGNTISNGDISPSSTDDTDFGSVNVAAGSNVNTFTIENLGTANLTLDSASPYVTITGDTGDFTLTANPSTPIAVSGNTTFNITFIPTQSGVRSAIISIANNDSDEDPYTFYIQGTGDLIEAGGVWSYLDDGSNQGTAWYGTGFNYAGWSTNNAEFGYGDGDETTVVSYGADPNNKHETTYFRRSFTITAADISSLKNSLILNAIRDDGMVVYINGIEVWRDHITGAVAFNTLADSPAIGGGDESTWITEIITNPFTSAGTYEIGVEIHQQSLTSSDISFNFSMQTSNILPPLLPAGGLWSYLDDGSDQGAAWQTADVTPTGANWASGNAQLGFNEGDEATVVADVNQITTYFRKTITASGTDITNSTLKISAVRDDGIVIYINGVEVLRNNMPVGNVDYTTLAFSDVTDSGGHNFEDFWNVFKVNNPLVAGDNEIAVEIHQFSATSDDISFNLEFETNNNVIYVPTVKPDRDNDGREDYVDADDDNDGIADLVEGCYTTLAETLETDGDGETDIKGVLPKTVTLNDGNAITYSANNTSNFTNLTAYDAGEHGYGLRMRGPIADGQLTLDFTDPVRNLFFKLIDFDGHENIKVDVYDEFGVIVDLTTQEGLYHLGSYIEYLGSNTINEIYNGAAPNINNPENRAHDIYGGAYFYFPNINVSKITFTANWNSGNTIRLVGVQYCSKDTDGDGIDDFYDSDSDNDGIPDLVEVGGTDTNGDGIVDTFIDADNDGITSLYDSDDNSYFIEELGTLTNLDFDGDGIRNNVDLDSDNDGILDIIEAGGTDADGDGQVDGFTDTDSDGYHDAFDGGGSLLITGADTNADGKPDSYPDPNDNPDNTGLPNFLDIDSDDDGITDHTEAQVTTATYIGFSGVDTDGDGVLDIFDNFVGFAGNGLTPTDSDLDGTPDYIDTNSDNHGELDIIEGHDVNGDGTVDSSDWGTCLNSITSNLGALSFIDSDNDGLDDGFDNDLITYDPSNSTMQPTSHPNIDDIATAERDWREADQEYNVIDFDGINDYIDFADSHDLTASFTLETWVKQDASSTGNGMLISKRDCNKGTNLGYSLSLVSHFPNIKWYDNSGVLIFDLTSTYPIGTDRWHSLSVTYDMASTTAKIYIDGIEVATSNAVSAPPSATNESLLVGAKFDDTDLSVKLSNEFKGWIDEIRVWNIALTPTQIREMMNQEIQQNGTAVQGKILLTDIFGLNWANLLGYYPLNTIVAGDLIDESSNTVNGRIRNILTAQPQTAPLPYTTTRDGEWTDNSVTTPWTSGDSVWKHPNALGIDGTTPIDWNIVVTSHNITSGDKNITVLGLITDTAATKLSIADPVEAQDETNSGQSLRVTNYLKMVGDIDLIGESQLLQDEGSVLDITSSGVLERDQQGTQDLYTYNYWSSPVGTSNPSSNNNNYTLSNILSDGSTSATPISINFITSGYDGNKGATIGIADYWIWKYSNKVSDDYSSWQHVRSTGAISAGEGFTLKGVASSGSSFSSTQNYVFTGKPNNGDITLSLTSGHDFLVGNPYPSAIDADEFILDNIADGTGRAASNIINGALYFWEHFGSNTHYLSEYEGGYGTYTLMGGTAAITTDALINTAGVLASTKGAPQQYIPVSQGFFVSTEIDNALTGISTVTGGGVTFKNSQRVFKTEAADPSVFIKSVNTKTKSGSNVNTDVDVRQKIRLMFDSPRGYHRQLLAGVDENASDSFNIGYDAPLIEDNLEDMFWVFNNHEFVIQAVNNFDDNQKLPLGVKISQEGLAVIKIDQLENIPSNKIIYLFDKELNIYHDLSKNNYEVSLTPGEYLTRFEITFASTVSEESETENNANEENEIVENENNNSEILEEEQTEESGNLEVYYTNDTKNLVIDNPASKEINSAEIFNILGQSIYKFENIETGNYLEFKTKNLSPGTYIINIQTIEESVTKKVLVN
jgi:hypothetical protein